MERLFGKHPDAWFIVVNYFTKPEINGLTIMVFDPGLIFPAFNPVGPRAVL